MWFKGKCFSASRQSWEGEGTAEDFPEGVPDGEPGAQANESQLVSHGEYETLAVVLISLSLSVCVSVCVYVYFLSFLPSLSNLIFTHRQTQGFTF